MSLLTNLNKKTLSHVLWIGGGTDSGKSTSAREYAKRHGFAVYHYDHADRRHHDMLARTSEPVQAFLQALFDERWIHPKPKEMLDYLFTSH